MKLPLAIIGNGAAAAEAVLALRANGYRGEIHLFADNTHPPYNPMLGTYLVLGKLPLERVFPFGDEVTFYQANSVTAHLGQAVRHVDAESRVLTTSLDRSYEYEACLVATGARPAAPPVPGLREALAEEAAPAFTIQNLTGVLGLKQAVDNLRGRREPARAAVVGASFAGVKIASVLHDLGMQVSLVEREASILPLAAHPTAARIMEAHLLAEGYELRLGAALAGVEVLDGPKIRLDFGALPGAADPGGADGTACEESAPQEQVDLLVVCTGTRPALSFLDPVQVDIERGILIDERMRSNVPGLYAAGDVAQGRNLLSGRREIIGLWSSARYQGRGAGRSLAGAPSGYRGGIPHNITHVGGMLFASMGCVDEYDEVITTREGDSWQIRLLHEGRLVGINLLDCCLAAGVVKQALVRAAAGTTGETEATWISFRG